MMSDLCSAQATAHLKLIIRTYTNFTNSSSSLSLPCSWTAISRLPLFLSKPLHLVCHDRLLHYERGWRVSHLRARNLHHYPAAWRITANAHKPALLIQCHPIAALPTMTHQRRLLQTPRRDPTNPETRQGKTIASKVVPTVWTRLNPMGCTSLDQEPCQTAWARKFKRSSPLREARLRWRVREQRKSAHPFKTWSTRQKRD